MTDRSTDDRPRISKSVGFGVVQQTEFDGDDEESASAAPLELSDRPGPSTEKVTPPKTPESSESEASLQVKAKKF